MSWICPVCERELRSANQWHNCVNIRMDSLFEGKPPELSFISDCILSHIIDWKDVIVSTTQHCIVFVHHQTFLVIRPMKKQLDVKFYSETKKDEPPVFKSIFYACKYQNHVRLSSMEELTVELFSLMKESYQLL